MTEKQELKEDSLNLLLLDKYFPHYFSQSGKWDKYGQPIGERLFITPAQRIKIQRFTIKYKIERKYYE